MTRNLWLAWMVLGLTGGSARGADMVEAGPLNPPGIDLYENRVEVESASYLSLNLFNIPIDHAKAKDVGRFKVYSLDDGDFGPNGVAPVASGGRTRTIKVPVRNPGVIKQTSLFLQLPRPMKPWHTYGVRATDLGGPVPAIGPVRFDDRRTVNDNLRVNQLGYLPESPKRAYVGQYMGDLGPMPVEATEFELLDGMGKRVFKGAVRARGVGDQYVGQTVYELDFTPFETVGTYRVFMEGIGLSYPFDIGPRALAPLYANLMRGNFQQRCGQEVTAEFSRHTKDACHLDDAFWDPAAEKLKFVAPKHPPLYPAVNDGKRHEAIHGHHDAGDYGKYTSSGASYVFSILNAMEAFPTKFREDRLGLPYSGNGIPDLLEEVKWELDWLEHMQDETDGGVSGVIRPRNGGYEQYLPPKSGGRFFFPKDTVFTAAYAGALAHAARSPLMKRHYPKDCARYLEKAVRAWGFLEKNARYVEYFHYGAVFGDWDERCWAAVELYGATGEAKYHDYYLKQFDPARKRWDWWPMFEAVGYATQAYLFLPADRPRDERMLKRCEDALRAACEQYVADAANHPYRLSMGSDMLRKAQYGWFFPADITGYDLLTGYARTKDRRYLDCALSGQDYTCGANPSGYFLQTGLGAKRNIEVVNQQSWYDDIIEPVPGIPLGIGTPGFYYIAEYGKSLGEGEYPANWPPHNRWYDGFNVSSEVTTGPWARETIVAGFFGGGEGVGERPRIKLKADVTAGPAPLTVRFGFDRVGNSKARIRQAFWDFDDETFSTLASPAHVFKAAGKHHRVAVTVIDEDGLSAYDTVDVDCTLAEPKFAREAAAADAKTVALFHFDGDLKDAGPNKLEMKAKAGMAAERQAFRFADFAPRWMASPAGSCVEMSGAEQFVCEIPWEAMKSPAETPWTLEAMVYVKEFAGWAYPGNPLLLGLSADNDSWVGWRQETWEKARLPIFRSAGGAGVGVERFKDFPRERWCQVRVAYDGKGVASFFVDGEKWGEARGVGFKNAGKKAPLLSVGPIKGMVDEVRLRVGE